MHIIILFHHILFTFHLVGALVELFTIYFLRLPKLLADVNKLFFCGELFRGQDAHCMARPLVFVNPNGVVSVDVPACEAEVISVALGFAFKELPKQDFPLKRVFTNH